MLNFEYKKKYTVYDLKNLIAYLRSDSGCPWDREQTHESIRRNLIEEAYEAAEAIDEKNLEHLREELGDVLTQVIFHAGIEEDLGNFDLDDIADGVCKKMILRHPHVFGNTSAADADQVLNVWDDIKRIEKNQKTVTDSLRSVSVTLPSLWRAEKIQKKAEKSGLLDFSCIEISDICNVVSSTETKDAFTAVGDILFAVVSVARHAGVDPEDALQSACVRFISHFAQIENER